MSSILKVSEIQDPTNGNTAASIQTNGTILPTVYAFRATKHVAVNWTTGGGTGNAITFNNISSNSAFNSGFDLSEIGSTGKIFIPVDGIYRISASFLLQNSNTSAGHTYITVELNDTTGGSGAPGTTLQNDYGYFPASTHRLVKLNTIFKATSSDFVAITKQDSLKYWGNGTNLASSTWGYNQVTCELIGVSL